VDGPKEAPTVERKGNDGCIIAQTRILLCLLLVLLLGLVAPLLLKDGRCDSVKVSLTVLADPPTTAGVLLEDANLL
jgi:hypothetical protein